MIKNESKPNATEKHIFSKTLHNTVGNHLDSLESVNKNTASLYFTNSLILYKSSIVYGIKCSDTKCPGIGILI